MNGGSAEGNPNVKLGARWKCSPGERRRGGTRNRKDSQDELLKKRKNGTDPGSTQQFVEFIDGDSRGGGKGNARMSSQGGGNPHCLIYSW